MPSIGEDSYYYFRLDLVLLLVLLRLGIGGGGGGRLRVVEAIVAEAGDIAGALLALANHLGRHLLQVVGLSDGRHGVDEQGGQIAAGAQFRGGVVPGESYLNNVVN